LLSLSSLPLLNPKIFFNTIFLTSNTLSLYIGDTMSEELSSFVPSWLVTRIKLITNTSKVFDAIISLCSQKRYNELEQLLLYLAGDGATPSRLLLIPSDDVVEDCVCISKDNKLIVLFKTKTNGVYGVAVISEPVLHIRPASDMEIGSHKEGMSKNGVEIKVM